MKRSLADVLLEIRKITIKDDKEVMDCIYRLANQNVCDLLGEVISDFDINGPFEESVTNLLLSCHDEIATLTNDEKLYALQHLTFLEFMCLLDYAVDCTVGTTCYPWTDNLRQDMYTIINSAFKTLHQNRVPLIRDFMRINFYTFKDILISSPNPYPFKYVTSGELTMLSHYFKYNIDGWDCHFFRVCPDYDIYQVRAHFVELAKSFTAK